MTKEKTLELMSPAGSWEALRAALQAGADSLYFGVEQLNMRARSSNNFEIDHLAEIVSVCKEKNAKPYLTLNTILYDHDISLMKNILERAKADGIPAVIASDHAAMNYARRIGLPVHISTQANVTNIETVEFYSAFADVMVLARELSLRQVADIHREIKRREITGPSGELIRLEVFGHGALCMAVSGKCYLSLHTDYASANRGACVQNCRRSYIVTDKEEGHQFEIDNEYIMSASDLCTIDLLQEIVDAGISVLKIEGRGRASDYVYTTTLAYRQAIDMIYDGTYTVEKAMILKEELKKVYNRGFWEGYYMGRELGEWSDSYGSQATEKKIYLGKAVKFFDKLSVGEFAMETGTLQSGDTIFVSGPISGVQKLNIEEIRVNDQIVKETKKGEHFTCVLNQAVKPGDKLYKITEA